MKRLVLAGSFLFFGSALMPAADWTIPWFRTRPKPIVLAADNPQAAQVPHQTRIEYHGKAAFSSAGRLYFPAVSRERIALPQTASPQTTKQRSTLKGNR